MNPRQGRSSETARPWAAGESRAAVWDYTAGGKLEEEDTSVLWEYLEDRRTIGCHALSPPQECLSDTLGVLQNEAALWEDLEDRVDWLTKHTPCQSVNVGNRWETLSGI
jgi:hypothetical protein